MTSIGQNEPQAAPNTLTIRQGTVGELGGARIGVSRLAGDAATLVYETPEMVSITQVVRAGELVVVLGHLFRTVAVTAGSPGSGAPGSGSGSVTVERTLVTVPGLSVDAKGLVLTTGGLVYLGPGKSQLSELAISVDAAHFQVGSRTGGPKSPMKIMAGGMVEIDGRGYEAVRIVAADSSLGITGWLEMKAR